MVEGHKYNSITQYMNKLLRYIEALKWFRRKEASLNGSHLAKMKKYNIPYNYITCHKVYKVEAVGLKSSNYTLKITIFVKILEI